MLSTRPPWLTDFGLPLECTHLNDPTDGKKMGKSAEGALWLNEDRQVCFKKFSSDIEVEYGVRRLPQPAILSNILNEAGIHRLTIGKSCCVLCL